MILRDINSPFEHEKKKEISYEPVKVINFWSNNYIEYKSNGDKDRILSVEEFLDKIRPYLRDIINDIKQFGIWII